MMYSCFLGIDISKETLDVAAIDPEGRFLGHTKVSNSKDGFREMVKWVRQADWAGSTGTNRPLRLRNLLACAEHTGVYGHELRGWLDESGIKFSFVPAIEIQRSLGMTRGKNDSVDARRIAEYARLRRDSIRLSHKPSKAVSRLRTLLSERKWYVRARAALQSRNTALHKYESAESRRNRTGLTKQYDKCIKSLDAQILTVIRQDEDVMRNYKLVKTVTGIGLVNAANIIAYTDNFSSFETARQYACYVGIAPFEHTSGKSVNGKTRVSGFCNHQLKAELTMAAIVAVSKDAWLKNYFERKMAEKGSTPGAYGIVLNAVKFKLVARMFAVVKSGESYKR